MRCRHHFHEIFSSKLPYTLTQVFASPFLSPKVWVKRGFVSRDIFNSIILSDVDGREEFGIHVIGHRREATARAAILEIYDYSS